MAILYEGINRACEYSYYTEHHTFSDSVLDYKLKGEMKIGYIWIEEMVKTWFSDAIYHFKMETDYDLIFETK